MQNNLYNHNQIETIDFWRRIMRKSSMIKFLLLMSVIFIFLLCLFVSWAQQDENTSIKKEMILPAPALPAL